MIKKNTIKKVKYDGKIYEFDANDTQTSLRNIRELGEQIFDHLEVPAHRRDYLCYLEMCAIEYIGAGKFKVDGETVANLIIRFYCDDQWGGMVESFFDFIGRNAESEWKRHGAEWNDEQYQLFLEALWIWAVRTPHYRDIDEAAIFEIVQETSS